MQRIEMICKRKILIITLQNFNLAQFSKEKNLNQVISAIPMHFHETKQKQTPKTLGIHDLGSTKRQFGQNSDSTVALWIS